MDENLNVSPHGSNTMLSAALLSEYGFKQVKIDDSPFDDYKMPYFCKDAVILLYNEGEGNEHSFYIGYGEGRFGKYTVVPFRWIHTEKELLEIYKAVRGVELLSGKLNRNEISQDKRR